MPGYRTTYIGYVLQELELGGRLYGWRLAIPHDAVLFELASCSPPPVQLESLWPRLKALTNDLDVADPYTAPLIPRALECDDDLSAVATHLRSLVALRYGGR